MTQTPSTPDPQLTYLRQIDLARRWRMSERTLEGWRCKGRGPSFLKLGGKVLYRLHDVEAYEKHCLKRPSASVPSVTH